MSSRILFILKIIVIVVLSVAIIGTGIFFVVKIIKKKNNNPDDNTNQNTNPIFSTNSYNEAISGNKLVTVNYSGSYKFDSVDSVYFNEKSDSNPNGLTQKDIETLLSNYIQAGGKSEFCEYLNKKKLEEVAKNNEYITIVTPTDSNGKISSYGVYTKNTKENVISGNFIGDDNLAVAVINDAKSSKDCEFFSLNYRSFYDAVAVSNNKNPQENIIYAYREVYSKENPDLLLFTVTYKYKLIIEDTSIPSKDLSFDI